MVNGYERLYGTIGLDSYGIKTPLGGTGIFARCLTPLPNNPQPVIQNSRNEQLVMFIKNRIPVVYGAAHVDPVIIMLQLESIKP